MVQPLTFLRTRDFLPRTALGLRFVFFFISSKRSHFLVFEGPASLWDPWAYIPTALPISAGSGCFLNPPTRQSRCRVPIATKPHVLQNPHSGSLPSTSAVPRGPACTLASTSASPPIPHSSLPHKLLSLPSGPSFQLVIGLRGQDCEMCLNHRLPPPTDAHLYAVLPPFACWLLIKDTEADPAPPHSQSRASSSP